MPRATLSVRYQLGTVMKRFRFEEFEDAVLPIFPELQWPQIKSKLVQRHESLTTPHVVKVIEDKIKEIRLHEDELKDRLASLDVIDVSRHYRRKIWYCHEFKGKGSTSNLILNKIETRIQDSFNAHQMPVDVKTVESDNVIFLSVKDRPKKKKVKNLLPTHFCLVKDENFFFCSKKMVSKPVILALTYSMGYQSCKSVKLTGRDIHSLIRMLLTRKNAAAEGNIIKRPLRFRQSPPTITALGLDFTQHKQRKKYAEKCFGENPPTFEFLRVKCSDQPWKTNDEYENLPDNVIYTGIEFRSLHVPNFLKHLVTQQVLLTPLPCYAANVLTIARNDMTMKEN